MYIAGVGLGTRIHILHHKYLKSAYILAVKSSSVENGFHNPQL